MLKENNSQPKITENPRGGYEQYIWNLDRYRIEKSYKLLEGIPVGKILDIGCMAGQYMVPLLKKGWDCYGVEITDAYKIAQARGIKCICHDVSKGIPFDDSYFDVIWAEEVIEHLLDTDFFLEECYRVLKVGGVIVLSTPNLASLINRFKLFMGQYPRYVQYNNGSHGHVRYYTLAVLKNQLFHYFEVNKVLGNFVSLPDPTDNKVIRRFLLSPLGSFLPTLSENIIVKAQKVKDLNVNELAFGQGDAR